MRIIDGRVLVIIGRHRIWINADDVNDHRIQSLFDISKQVTVRSMVIELPRTSEAAKAFIEIEACPNLLEDLVNTDLTQEQIDNLKKQVKDCSKLDNRARHYLMNFGCEFIWQVCEKTDDELIRAKNFGRGSLGLTKKFLDLLHLRTGMGAAIDRVREQMPKPGQNPNFW